MSTTSLDILFPRASPPSKAPFSSNSPTDPQLTPTLGDTELRLFKQRRSSHVMHLVNRQTIIRTLSTTSTDTVVESDSSSSFRRSTVVNDNDSVHTLSEGPSDSLMHSAKRNPSAKPWSTSFFAPQASPYHRTLWVPLQNEGTQSSFDIVTDNFQKLSKSGRQPRPTQLTLNQPAQQLFISPKKTVVQCEHIVGVWLGEDLAWVVPQPPGQNGDTWRRTSVCIVYHLRGELKHLCLYTSDYTIYQKWVRVLYDTVMKRQTLTGLEDWKQYYQVVAERLWSKRATCSVNEIDILRAQELFQKHYVLSLATHQELKDLAHSGQTTLPKTKFMELVERSAYFPTPASCGTAELENAVSNAPGVDGNTHSKSYGATSLFAWFSWLKSVISSRAPLERPHFHRFAGSPTLPVFLPLMGPMSTSTTSTSLHFSNQDEGDMSHPLNEYFIDSSHNTYLEGDQLTSRASVGAYVLALLDGCRSLEIDIWYRDDDLVVTHGLTLTSKIPLRHVLQAIAKYAFVTTPYPLILSLEIHCDEQQQVQLADELQTYLGDLLLTTKLEEAQDRLPSPRELEGKILIKNRDHLHQSPPSSLTGDSSLPSDALPVPKSEYVSFSSSSSLSPSSPSSSVQSKPTFFRTSSSSSGSRTSSLLGVKRQPVAKAMADLNVYLRSSRLKVVQSLKSFENMFSVSEKDFPKFVGQPRELIQVTQQRLLRVFPKLTRIMSTNYHPLGYWAVGCQMVALNYQSPDIPMEFNKVMFDSRGNLGYIRKPAYLRGSFTPAMFTKHSIRLQLLGGIHLPFIWGKNGTTFPKVEVELVTVNTKLLQAYLSKNNVSREFRKSGDVGGPPTRAEDLVTTNTTVLTLANHHHYYLTSKLLAHRDTTHIITYEPTLTFVHFRVYQGKDVFATAIVPFTKLTKGVHPITLLNPIAADAVMTPMLLINVITSDP
ncbi:1-phosphatidylinositol 4,5-bisphosphate phosphodiesterase zeta-1 [Dispira simplex]|nr:1-phosphatidylinositol 4,5-bisphosphate phosphodiesterase zeta-1 [Dispira simplex]